MFKRAKKIFNNNKFIFITAIFLGLYIFSKLGNTFLPIEELSVPSAIGYDVVKKDDDMEYKVPMSIYNYPGQEVSSMMITGEAGTVPRTRAIRQLQAPGKFIVGLEKILVMSERASRFGIENWLDILWANRTVNDTGFMVVSKHSAEEIIMYKVEGYPSAGDYIQDVIKHLDNFNFFSENYKMIDVFIRANSEGRSVVLPYIEILDNKLQVTGLALFKRDKMMENVNINEARVLNLLREDGVRGMIQVRKNAEEYLSFSGTSKKTVECKKKDGKYVFNIKLMLKGEVLSNTLYKNLVTNPEERRKIEKDLAKETENMCRSFIKKMQSDYKVDCLELGRYAVEKYGRRKNIDWDEAVSNAQINVSAKVIITELGRGDY